MSESNRKILIADDAHSIRVFISHFFAKAGHVILEADNGESAIFTAREFLPDLIILDINMPKLGGIDVLGVLRLDPQFDHSAILILTSERDTNIVKAAIEG